MFPIPECYRLKKINRNLKWCILWVSSRQYQTQTHEFLNDFSAWIPGKKTTSKSGDDCLEISEPLFPGYIFVGVDDMRHLPHIESVIHKSRLFFYFLRDMLGKYYSMTYLELEKMVQSGRDGATTDYDSGIHVGSRVRISVGPYTGVIGKVTSVTHRDIKVQATCMGKDLLVVVHRNNYLVLEPINDR